MMEDSALLRDYAANRTESAFAELVRRHLNLVYSAAMRRTNGDPHQAQDISQIVFNDLARSADAVARHPTLAGWFHTATRNAAINAARADRRRRFYEKEASAMNEVLSSPAAVTDWNHLQPVIDEAIDDLSQPDHDAVVLRFLEGRPFAEVGQALRISEDAARMRVERALEKLRRLLIRRGVTSSAAAISLGLTSYTGMAAPSGMAATVTGSALTYAVSTGKAGAIAATWTALTGTKLALGTTGAALLVTAGVVSFVASDQNPAPRPPSPVAAEIVPQASQPEASPTPVPPDDVPSREYLRAAVRTNPTEPPRAPATAHQRAKLLRSYAPLFDHVALAPTQREQLLTLLVDEFEVAADYAAAASASGVDPTVDALSFDFTVRRLREKIQEDIKTLVGEAGYVEYLKVRQNLRAEAWMTELETRLDQATVPLNPQQSQQLRALLKEDGRDPKASAMLEEVSRFLSATQMAAFREFQAERIAGSRSKKVQDAVREGTAQGRPGS